MATKHEVLGYEYNVMLEESVSTLVEAVDIATDLAAEYARRLGQMECGKTVIRALDPGTGEHLEYVLKEERTHEDKQINS